MPTTHWIVPTLAGIFIGFGIFSVFLQCLNYIIDAYLMFSASAIAANTIMRSLFGAIFPLFAVCDLSPTTGLAANKAFSSVVHV